MKLIPKNWAQFQHYGRRRPPWIKLHRGLLDDYEFHCLPVASRALAPILWLLASEHDDGCIDAETDALAFRLRMAEKDLLAALKPLIQQGFFTDASNTLAPCKQLATSETEVETETKTETEGEARKRARQLPADFQPTDAHRELARELQVDLQRELAAFTDYHQAKGSMMKSWDAALRTWLRNARRFNPAKPEKLNAINRDFSKVDYRKGVNEDGSF